MENRKWEEVQSAGRKASRLEERNSGRGFGLNRAKVNWREDKEVPEPFHAN
jgi:hypothetical protein